MTGVVDFDINQGLKQYLSDPASVATPEADPALVDCENDSESLTAGLINSVLNPIVDSVAESPENIAKYSNFDSLQLLLKLSPFLPPAALSRVLDTVVSGLSTQAEIIYGDVDTEEAEVLQHHKQLLEIYGFLLQWTISAVEAKAAEKSASVPVATARGKGGKGSKAKASSKDAWDFSSQIQNALDVMSKTLKLKLVKLFQTTSERDTFVGLLTRAVYLVLESEARVKSTAIRMHCFKTLCIAIKHHGHAYGAQTSVIQNLSYFEHLSEPMAEFLHILAEQYDYPQLTEEILRELSAKEFNSNDVKGPKAVSNFVTKLSELAPRLVMKQMTLLAKFLDSESYTLRCSIIEVCGNLVSMLSNQEAGDQAENHKAQINGFFDVLEERFLDLNPYCRCRVLQVYVKICDLETKYPKRRQAVAELATRSLEDKSSNVRRNAVKLLGKLISSHPFSLLHGGQLSHKDWYSRLEAVEAELNALKPPAGAPGLGENGKSDSHIDEELLDDATEVAGDASQPKQMTDEQYAAAMQKAAEEAATSETIGKLQLTKRYYVEALKFIDVLHEASSVICQLLMSKNKSEVIEAMDFFMIADAYKIELARIGIRKMLHLIWTKGNSDEGKGVKTHLIDCYKGIFFDAPGSFNANDAANYVARNMISLTFGASLAELTSLEQLLSTMMKGGMISELVIAKLWQVYGVQKKEISKNQRRGAIIVLGMLALADPDIIVKEMEALLRVGLGRHGASDLILAKYTCIALARLKPSGRAVKSAQAPARLSNDHAVIGRLAAMTEMISDSKDWYGMAEQAIGAMYTLSKHPDILCSEIIRRKTRLVFQQGTSKEVMEDHIMEDVSGIPTPPPEQNVPKQKSALALAQLLFIVGHVAIKQIVHLELCEMDFKRRKAEKEKVKPQNASPTKKGSKEDNEFDLIGGTTEDDFTEAMSHIREREILYGANSLLSNFGPLVTEICSNNLDYNDQNLQAVATICMAKLMCVSSEFCEQNLPLLITILERSEDPITRSNVVIALGDMAVCFNNLIDENTDFLYRRLNDNDASVKRTCLMTLTFLILAGQVKVKGQLGEMAKCLEDSDKRIADLSRMFFTELATKDNAVYNQFIDMFSVLSADNKLEEDSFKRILKFLTSFIEKDKHAKQLSQKLAVRLTRADTQRQWNDVAYALSLLQHKDEDIQKTISEGFQLLEVAA